jgi:hypothetical protein
MTTLESRRVLIETLGAAKCFGAVRWIAEVSIPAEY